MSENSMFLPGNIRDRIQDLMKSHKVTQAELAARIGCSESMLSRFISGKTDKLGDENIIRIARVFNVSTDFLLGEVDVPDRVNYDISELGLSVQAARNLYTQKVNPKVVNALLKNPEFANRKRPAKYGQSPSAVSGRKRYNTLDFAGQNRVPTGCCSPLLDDPEPKGFHPSGHLQFSLHVGTQTVETQFAIGVKKKQKEASAP